MSGIENKIQTRKESSDGGLDSLSLRAVEGVERAVPEPEQQHDEQLSTIDVSLARPEVEPRIEKEFVPDYGFGNELEMLPAREYLLEDKQADVEAGQGVKGRRFGFRGHSGGGRTILDRFVTMIADFVKLIEVKIFRWLERRRIERLNRKLARSAVNVVIPELGPAAPQPKKKKTLLGLLIGWER